MPLLCPFGDSRANDGGGRREGGSGKRPVRKRDVAKMSGCRSGEGIFVVIRISRIRTEVQEVGGTGRLVGWTNAIEALLAGKSIWDEE